MIKLLANWKRFGKLNWHIVIAFSFCSCFTQTIFAQNVTTPDIQLAENFIASRLNYDELYLSTFVCVATRQSPYSTYYTFQQYFNHIQIENKLLKVGIDDKQQLTLFAGDYQSTTGWTNRAIIAKKLNADYLLPNGKLISANTPLQPLIRVQENQSIYVYTYDLQDEDNSRYTIVVDENDEIMEVQDHKVFFAGQDSTVIAKVFLPDPLTTAEVTYGAPFVDDNDSDIAELNYEAAIVTMKVLFEDGVFYLKNDNIIIKDINVPTAAVVTSIIPEFNYTRSESGFEDVNTFYHLTNFCNDIVAAGYTSLQDFYIEIDPHGASGADQSFYVSAAIPTIQFGEGGVDDAEDADVIVHEFSHALSDHASPLSNSGLERRAIDEGYGDYFAASYSRKFSDYNWEKIFSWDGHNEFWFGRNANTTKHYPEDNSDNIYAASEIWSGALMDIFDVIGKTNCDQLVYEALFGSFPNMTMPDGASLILNAEATIFGGLYYEQVFDALFARGLIYPNAVTNITNNKIQLLNTNGFAFFDEPLVIQFNQYTDVILNCYSVDGKLLAHQQTSGTTISWKPEITQQGLYIIDVVTPTGTIATKICHY
ncbi:MAG TPA: hypothetical protein PLN38_05130 [Chitinophagales bacterium]|nr:hypothetical protein [Chitinophagales bacterium]